MRLILAAAMVTIAFAQPVDCRNDLVARWNKFAKDANAYVMQLDAGKVNYMQRARVESEFRQVTRCECW